MSDHFFDRETLCPKRAASRLPSITPKEREILSHCLQDAKQRERKKQVVFFGDGNFRCSTQKHNSLPKKRLLNNMATKGLVFLIDEFYTSKMCPCGHSPLTTKDDTSKSRLRRHTTGDTVCPLSHHTEDRDELACINMLNCALRGIRGQDRPSFLCRPCDN